MCLSRDTTLLPQTSISRAKKPANYANCINGKIRLSLPAGKKVSDVHGTQKSDVRVNRPQTTNTVKNVNTGSYFQLLQACNSYFSYKNTLYKNTEARFAQKIRTGLEHAQLQMRN